MMQQQTGGYLAPSRRNPLGLTLVIAGHVAVLGAIALSPPKFIRERVKDFIVTSIPDEPPPPPEVPPEPAKPQPEAKSVVDTPKAVVESPLTQTIDLATVQVDPPPLPPMPPELPRVETPPSPPQIVDASLDPRYASRFQPEYPPSLARNEVEGVVVVRVLIGTDGRVKAVEQVSSREPAFFAATQRQALSQWRFRPATRDGVAVESWRTMTVRFRMA